MYATDLLLPVIQQFQYSGQLLRVEPFGNGHINDTYLLTFADAKGEKHLEILQRMNRLAFLYPEKVMENVMAVTAFLQKRIAEEGGDPTRETLSVIPTKEQKAYVVDADGEYWRSYHFVEDTICFDVAETPEVFYESALAFGKFQHMLADYPAHTLHETIVQFHDTRNRLQQLEQAIAEDSMKRAALVQEEIAFIRARREVAEFFALSLEKNELPLRVTHNDTKLNNVMMDVHTKKGVCVIDLDTVMPGLAMYDFGDAIRFGASTAAEDETDLSKVSCSMELFDVYTKGFLEGCAGSLTEKEIRLLPMGAKVITLECGIRFLTDYLKGDCYFKTSREGQNLDRCRTQLALVRDMEKKWDEMEAIVAKYV